MMDLLLLYAFNVRVISFELYCRFELIRSVQRRRSLLIPYFKFYSVYENYFITNSDQIYIG